MMAKKEIDAGSREFSIKVDDTMAVKNLTRLGKKTGLAVKAEDIPGGFLISFFEQSILEGDASASAAVSKEGLAHMCLPSAATWQSTAVFIGKDYVGEGDGELGRSLMNMALYTFTEVAEKPDTLVFMNSGVKLVAQPGAESIEHVKKLEDFGVQVLVCGACLNFYGLHSSLEAGEVSNMYDILESLMDTSKVITL